MRVLINSSTTETPPTNTKCSSTIRGGKGRGGGELSYEKKKKEGKKKKPKGEMLMKFGLATNKK